MEKADKFILECLDCGTQYDPDRVRYLCPVCSSGNSSDQPPQGVLKTLYDYLELSRWTGKREKRYEELKHAGFLDLLPIRSTDSLPRLRVGGTPLYPFGGFHKNAFPFRLFLKDDSQNPTFSFKDRASALVSAVAREQGMETIVAASTGNAGSSIAGMCASQGQQAVVLVPEQAPLAKLVQIIMYGACIVPVKGGYDDAFELSIKATERFGWYNRNTAYNPFTIEGKKTVSFELFGQLQTRVPDRIFVPVGDGVIISGVYKGFEDLWRIGLTDRLPVIVGVQAEGSDNLARNLTAAEFQSRPGHTLADSIAVDVPRNFLMARHYLHRYEGEVVTVSDEAILDASVRLAAETGIFTEPASAAAYAGMLKCFHAGMIRPGSDNVVLLTGSGLKDLKSVGDKLHLPAAIEPGIDRLSEIWETYLTNRNKA